MFERKAILVLLTEKYFENVIQGWNYFHKQCFRTASETYKREVRAFRARMRRYDEGCCVASAGKISPYVLCSSSADDTVTASLGMQYLANHSFRMPSVTMIGGLRSDKATRNVLGVVYCAKCSETRDPYRSWKSAAVSFAFGAIPPKSWSKNG